MNGARHRTYNNAMPNPVVSTDLQPYFEKGIQAYTQGSYEYAVDLLTFVIRHAPDATEARRYLRLATQKQFTNSPPSPITQAARSVLMLPVRGWAMLLELQGRTRQAISLYEWLVGFSPRSQSLLLQLATALTQASLEDAALQIYEELLSINPNHVGALRKLARLAMKHGNDAQARQCFERVLKLHPGDLEAQQSLRNLDALSTIKKGFSA